MATIRNRDVTMADHWYNFGIKDWWITRRGTFADIKEYLNWCIDLSEVFFDWLRKGNLLRFIKLPMTISLRKVPYEWKLYTFVNYFGGKTSFKPFLFKKYHILLHDIPANERVGFNELDTKYINHERKFSRNITPYLEPKLKELLLKTDKEYDKVSGFSASVACRIMTQLRRVLLDSIEMNITRKHHCFCLFWSNEDIRSRESVDLARYKLLDYHKFNDKIELEYGL